MPIAHKVSTWQHPASIWSVNRADTGLKHAEIRLHIPAKCRGKLHLTISPYIITNHIVKHENQTINLVSTWLIGFVWEYEHLLLLCQDTSAIRYISQPIHSYIFVEPEQHEELIFYTSLNNQYKSPVNDTSLLYIQIVSTRYNRGSSQAILLIMQTSRISFHGLTSIIHESIANKQEGNDFIRTHSTPEVFLAPMPP